MTNRITRYDAGEWLELLIRGRLIDYGEPVVAAGEAMMQDKDLCYFEDDDEEDT